MAELSITKVQDGAVCYRDTHGNEPMDTHNTGKNGHITAI